MSAQPYILPTTTVQPFNGLTLTQFLQTVFTGISGLAGNMVRPAWQVEPPKEPDINVNWMSVGIESSIPDANAYTATQPDESYVSQRHELLEIGANIYGPDALEIAGIIRDGFQIPTNIQALLIANMGFVETGPMRHIPDLVNQRFINRVTMSTFLRREIQRVYPVLTLVSASGIIYVPDINADYMLEWTAQP